MPSGYIGRAVVSTDSAVEPCRVLLEEFMQGAMHVSSAVSRRRAPRGTSFEGDIGMSVSSRDTIGRHGIAEGVLLECSLGSDVSWAVGADREARELGQAQRGKWNSPVLLVSPQEHFGLRQSFSCWTRLPSVASLSDLDAENPPPCDTEYLISSCARRHLIESSLRLPALRGEEGDRPEGGWSALRGSGFERLLVGGSVALSLWQEDAPAVPEYCGVSSRQRRRNTLLSDLIDPFRLRELVAELSGVTLADRTAAFGRLRMAEKLRLAHRVYDEVLGAIWDLGFEQVDVRLRVVDVRWLPRAISIALLSATFAWRTHLPSRLKLFSECEAAFVETFGDKEAASLLGGLKG